MYISEVMHTKAYKLNNTCKYIIHACGPRWSDYNSNAKKSCFVDLKDTFFNILIYAENVLKDASSIAIPLISSGIFGVPRKVCCEALFNAIDEYMCESVDSIRVLKLIKLTNIDRETFSDLQDYFRSNLNFEMTNNDTLNDNDDGDKLNRTNSLSSKDAANKLCCMCKTYVKSTQKIKCGCEYCVDCIESLEQSHDNICQSEKCTKSPEK